jgi:hypothetical protein
MLAVLRSKGKKVFLVSDAHPGFLENCMHATLGGDWLDLFDLIIAQSNKPLFQKSESIFYEWNYKEVWSKKPLGKKLKTVTQMI